MGPNSPFNLNNRTGDGKTSLHRAVIDKDSETAKTLLLSGAAVGARDHAGNEPLHYAALSGMPGMVKLLLKSGANPDSRGQGKRSPLHMAVSESNLAIVDILLAQGVDICAQDDHGDTPLHLALPPANTALERGRLPPIVRVLVEFGSDLNKPNAAGLSPFLKLLASPHESLPDREFRGHEELVHFFLKHGGSVTTVLRDGRTPLQLFLAQCGDNWDRVVGGNGARVLHLFLERGALVDTATASGDPLVVYFLKSANSLKPHHKALATLVCSLVDVDSDLGAGNTALHMVLLQSGYYGPVDILVPMIELLLQRGGHPNRRNMNGETPLFTLFARDLPLRFASTTLKLLLNSGAEVSQRVIMKAAGRFPNEDPILRPLLQAYLRQLDNAPPAQENHSTPAAQQWWDDWACAGKSGQWRDAKHLMHLPTVVGIGKELVLKASTVLAEKLIKDSRDKVRPEPADRNKEREYVAEILQYCRSHGIPVDMEYFDYLVELCL